MSTNVICVLVQQFSVFDDSVSSRSTSAYYCFQAVTPKSAPVVIDLWTGVPISWLLTLTAFISLFCVLIDSFNKLINMEKALGGSFSEHYTFSLSPIDS